MVDILYVSIIITFYVFRRNEERALKEAISKGEIDGDDEKTLIRFKQTISPVKRDVIQII